MILIKLDGLLIYNFVNVVDDYLMGIIYIVRGNEYFFFLFKYNRLYEVFGWNVFVYVYCFFIMKDVYNKLLKRNGDVLFGDFMDKGYLKDVVFNYIVLFGWNFGINEEIFIFEELVEKFNYVDISKFFVIFDDVKFKWMNGEYIRKFSLDEFYEFVVL